MDIKKDFAKLFDLNIPSMDHFDYYMGQLSKTNKFKDVNDLFNDFINDSNNIDDIYSYKIDGSNKVIDFVKSTNAYTDMCYDKSLLDLPINKSFQYQTDTLYLSIDIISGNWTSLKRYDQLNELGDSYFDLLDRFDMGGIFAKSKYLRQFIFGNINPKKQQKVQRNIIQDVIRKYDSQLSVECVRNDEVIFKLDNFEDIIIISDLDRNRYHTKLFSIERVEDFRIDTYFNETDNTILGREMVGVNGSEFYLKLKQYITGEDIDIRDLYFKSNGKLAQWVI